jgi:hypothetical protein
MTSRLKRKLDDDVPTSSNMNESFCQVRTHLHPLPSIASACASCGLSWVKQHIRFPPMLISLPHFSSQMGTPLPPLANTKKDDGEFVPLWKQEVILAPPTAHKLSILLLFANTFPPSLFTLPRSILLRSKTSKAAAASTAPSPAASPPATLTPSAQRKAGRPRRSSPHATNGRRQSRLRRISWMRRIWRR